MLMRNLVTAVAMLSGVAQAGTVLETVHRDLTAKSTEKLMTTYAQNGQMRVDSAESNGFVIFKDDALYAINVKEHNYTVMDRATVKKMADTINPALKQMQERLEQMPPEQRAQMERLLGNKVAGTQKAPAREIRTTTRTDKVAGYSCTYAEVLEDGVKQDELCVVPPATLKGGDELVAAGQKMSALMQDMFKDIDAPWLKESVDRQIQDYARLGGIPVLTRHFADSKPVAETTIKSVRTEAIPAATFEVPAGYAHKELLSKK
jgi:hypothetical protein